MGGWRSGVRRLTDRTPLRIKLIAAVLVIVTLGLTLISVAGVQVLRGYLLGRVDDQLQSQSERLRDQVQSQLQSPDPRIDLRIPPDTFAVVINPSGAVIAVQAAIQREGTPKVPSNVLSRTDPFTVAGQDGSNAAWRLLAARLPDSNTLVLGSSMNEVEHTVNQLIVIDLLVGLGVLVLLAAVAILMVRASLRPLVAMEQTAEAISRGELSRRVPHGDPRTEIGRLGRSLNIMLTQIETAFRSRAESEKAARKAEEGARYSEDRMRRFVADASHELRTPLTAIRGFAEFYRQGAVSSPEELDRLIGRIEGAAARMGLLVEDLLLLARLDRQRPLDRRPVDMLALAADAVQEARVVAPGRPVELSVDGTLAYQVMGDEARLRQVLGNLLTNALTHTPDGTSVEVRLRPATEDEARSIEEESAAVCEVADQGPGLTKDQAERVFERFYRVDRARTHEDGGTGLGLAIVAALVAAHGGAVGVETAPGDGSTFRVILPLAAD